MSNRFGLRPEDLAALCALLAHYPAVQSALLFGSRAKGNYKQGSDVDIALLGEGVTDRMAAALAWQLNEETILPYHFDVLNYQTIANPDLVAHIDRVGQPLYSAPAQQETAVVQANLAKVEIADE